MCGIVGAMSYFLSPGEIDRFKELMIVSNLRGWDGAGVVGVDQKHGVHFLKSLLSGVEAIKSKAFEDLLNKGRITTLIGHTRYPTRGKVDYDATHPHVAGHIVGVHNGTMDHVLGHRPAAGESDSKLLFEAIRDVGIEETIRDSQGAFCLVYADKKENTINFIRNYKRPLSFASMANSNTFYWASEAGMLQYILGRHGQKFEITTMPENKLFTYSMDMGTPIKPMGEARSLYQGYVPAREVAGNTRPFQGGSHGGGSTSVPKTGSGSASTSQTSQNSKTSTPGTTRSVLSLPKPATPTPKFVIQPDGKMRSEYIYGETGEDDNDGELSVIYKETTRGHHVSIKNYRTLVEQGCAWCGNCYISGPAAAFANEPEVNWYEPEDYLCLECSEDQYTVDYLSLQHRFGRRVEARIERLEALHLKNI